MIARPTKAQGRKKKNLTIILIMLFLPPPLFFKELAVTLLAVDKSRCTTSTSDAFAADTITATYFNIVGFLSNDR